MVPLALDSRSLTVDDRLLEVGDAEAGVCSGLVLLDAVDHRGLLSAGIRASEGGVSSLRVLGLLARHVSAVDANWDVYILASGP